MSKATERPINFNFDEVLKDAVDRLPIKGPARSRVKPTTTFLIITALGSCIVGGVLPATVNAKQQVDPDECGGGGGYSGIPLSDYQPGGDTRREPPDKKPPEDPVTPIIPQPPTNPKSSTNKEPIEKGSKNNPSGRQRE